MKRIWKFIVDGNRWYDQLDEPVRFLFFFVLAGVFGMGSLSFYPKVGVWVMFAIILWRVPYRFVIDAKKITEAKN